MFFLIGRIDMVCFNKIPKQSVSYKKNGRFKSNSNREQWVQKNPEIHERGLAQRILNAYRS